MSQPSKLQLFFRKIAGLFYRFDEPEARPQITRGQLHKNLPVTSVEAPKGSHETAKQTADGSHEQPTEIHIAASRPEVPEFPFPENRSAPKPQPEIRETVVHHETFNNLSLQPDKKPAELDIPVDTGAETGRECVISEGARAAQMADVAATTGIRNKYAPIVSFRNVHKVFNPGTSNEFVALQNINFEIEDLPDVGEFIALVGPSGCGKSTVLNLIQGFQEVGGPTAGEVLVRNKPVTGPGRDRGMIFQKYSSFPHLTVLQNVMFGLELNQESLGYSPSVMEKLAREMLAKVGMHGHEDKFPYQLSGGQQQRVAIARTLVLKPRIILMDEPFSALDEPTRIEMQQLITNLWHEVEATVFIVTHSLAEAVYLSDRIFMFKAN
ncbi:MAG: ABC transporter related-protein, partial [uncultured bacterium]